MGFERARVTALLGHAERRLAELGQAVERAAAGGHDRCELCGGPIGEERLAAVPATRRCVGCAAAPPTRGLSRR